LGGFSIKKKSMAQEGMLKDKKIRNMKKEFKDSEMLFIVDILAVI